ncbi:MAG: ShlB/FhaC/HecB family hemolysin secretion/activation protein [Polaromonas sp.]|uniref:ShlB/FhaC/HecB family hemolysin secretion/activation protein n=1 Tax=Polaromonas sp. TaxID=1869339 RepID=UPI0032671623
MKRVVFLKVVRSARAALLLMPAIAMCQQPPPTVDPGRIRERFDVQPEASPAQEPPQLPAPPTEVVPGALASLKVTLKSIRIETTTVLPGNVLQARADSYTGREITGREIQELAVSLTAMYRNAGYILSLVVVPPQSFSDGTLTLRVVEGYIDKVHIQAGDDVSAHVKGQLAAIGEKIRASRPIQGPVLERYLLIANDFPGVELRSVLAPAQAPGAADLTLIASVKKVEGFAALDNYGSKYLGPGEAGLEVAVNQLLGVNDQWRFRGMAGGGSELAYAQLLYSQVVSTEGLRLSAAVSKARTRPGDILTPFDMRGNADTMMVAAAYPLLRTRNESVTARATYEHTDVQTDVLGTRVIEDHIRALRLGLTWRVLDRLGGQNSLDVDFSQGLGGTQESDLLKSRSGAKGVFNKLTFDYERTQPLASNLSLTVGLSGQWANTPLLSSEQYAVGGRRFGRAYEPAELVGERGLAFRAEPRYSGSSDFAGIRSWQLFSFYDIGKVWRVGCTCSGTPDSQSLASAGMGARLFLPRNVVAAIEIAWPLTKPIASYQPHGKDPRLLGTLLIRF